MDNNEYVIFLKSVLIKIENTLNFLKQKPPKHIPAYHKILGVQQKLAGLDKSYRDKLFPQLVKTRGIINYFTNGRYEEAYDQLFKLKTDLVHIHCEIENANNTVNKT
ncbi:hypothetical protein LCGC14_3090870 [marine sediment metagenome]|uniref:Uncharacterized protein n=1 Tax=marine sediment metagenome TaxID=412755 RepID=A0A0F8WB21_9ZZZZ